MRLVVSFTLDVSKRRYDGFGRLAVILEPRDEAQAIEWACALLPVGCEDIVIETEKERDRLRALAAEDQAWFHGRD